MKRYKKREKITLFLAINILAIIFFIVVVSFYSNRDEIYYIINGEETTADNSQNDKTQKNTPDTPDISNMDNIEEQIEYLQNIVFLGDSITQGFDIYRNVIIVDGENVFKDATIVASTGYGTRHAVADIAVNSINLMYKDKPMRPEDIVADRNEKYVFICLGLNDLSWIKTDEYIENYRKLIDNIQNKSPDKSVVILSVTPLVAGNQGAKMNNKVIADANNKLAGIAKEYDIQFLDWAAAIKGENGGLYESLSSDGYCHLKIEAYNRLAEYLMQHPVK